MLMHPSTTIAFICLMSVGLSMENSDFNVALLPMPNPATQEREREHREKAANPQTVAKAVDRLKQAVNGYAAVTNVCSSKGQEVEVEEHFEIVEATGCSIVVTTTKKNRPATRDLRFTLRVNLADLTTPTSIEPVNLSGCKSGQGALMQVLSRARPGKTIPTTRRSSDTHLPATAPDQEQEAPPRKSLAFFFQDTDAAKRATRALNRAVAVCGGDEWPDEDDLP
jgi:hypothetical protein